MATPCMYNCVSSCEFKLKTLMHHLENLGGDPSKEGILFEIWGYDFLMAFMFE